MSTSSEVEVRSNNTLADYTAIIGEEKVNELRRVGQLVSHLSLQHVNSTAHGGGVAELLHRMVPMFRELGVTTRWDVVTATNEFFAITKQFHNALHGHAEPISKQLLTAFLDLSRGFGSQFPLASDVVYIHDPQPIALIRHRKSPAKWVWRCHVDVSRAQVQLWQFLRRYITRYDAAVFSAAQYAQRLPVRQLRIAPSIDPLSDKNRELEPSVIDEVFQRLQIPRDLPIVTQVSRFDRLKDPVGVIRAYQLVRRYTRCRLVLVGGGAADDPEGAQVLAETRTAAGKDPLVHILELPPTSHIEINAIQRGSTILLQKSLREGFGLTVTEALWKQKPVVASAVGGIPLQVIDQFSGLLCHSIEGAALAIRQLLRNPALAQRLGDNAHEYVRQRFLITRQVLENLLLILSLQHKGDIIPVAWPPDRLPSWSTKKASGSSRGGRLARAGSLPGSGKRGAAATRRTPRP